MSKINLFSIPFKAKLTSNNSQKNSQSNPFTLNGQLSADTISFTKKKKVAHTIIYDTETITNYENVLEHTLKSTPNKDFVEKLKQVDGIHSLCNAQQRISSLSRYLKEDMIGFVVPKYTCDSKPFGGYQWFEKSMEFLIKGCKKDALPEEYPKLAKNLFGLLALHDNYWKSKDFVKYLSSLEQNEYIQSGIQGVNELIQENGDISFKGHGQMITNAYFSPLKFIPKLLNDGCAYTNKKLIQSYNLANTSDHSVHKPNNPAQVPSMEHIMPKSWGGACDDANYILTSQESNSKRGNIDLLSHLKGADGNEENNS